MLLRHIRYFLAVAEQGNFTRAAEALHVSQPTLSQQIKQLEDTLGAPLFDRSGRAVRLTDAGEAWMRYARLALQDLDAGARAIHDVATLARGHLRLAMTPTFTAYLVGPTIDAFYRRYPGITLSIEEMAQERIEALLAQDRLDLGIAFEMAQSAEVEAAALFSETLELMVGADHPLASHRRPLTLAEWQHLPLALLSGDFATRQFIDRYCTQLGFRPQVAVEANALGAIVEIVRRGQLATLLPAAIARENRQLKKWHWPTPCRCGRRCGCSAKALTAAPPRRRLLPSCRNRALRQRPPALSHPQQMHQPEAEANQRADDDKALAAAGIAQGEGAGDAAQQVDEGNDKQRGPQQRQRCDQARAGKRIQRPNKQHQRDTGGDDGRELLPASAALMKRSPAPHSR